MENLVLSPGVFVLIKMLLTWWSEIVLRVSLFILAGLVSELGQLKYQIRETKIIQGC